MSTRPPGGLDTLPFGKQRSPTANPQSTGLGLRDTFLQKLKRENLTALPALYTRPQRPLGEAAWGQVISQAELELELRPQLPDAAPQLSATSGPNRSLRVIPEDPRHQASAIHSKCPGQAPVNRGPAGATGVEGPSRGQGWGRQRCAALRPETA